MTLLNSAITGHGLSGSPGIPLKSGGLYLQGEPFTLRHSELADNVPNDCFGC